jgi:hypothetical protein
VPDLAALRACFAPAATILPEVAVHLPPIASYDALLPNRAVGATV